MANETLSIQKDDARLTVIGKSKADTYIDSGLGLDLDDLDIGSLDPFDLNWQTDVPDPDNLPDEIRIITPPTKMEYHDGEKLNLDGMVVGAYKNGVIWTDSKYTNGHIPLSELMISPLVVTIESANEKYVSEFYQDGVSCEEGNSVSVRFNGQWGPASYTFLSSSYTDSIKAAASFSKSDRETTVPSGYWASYCILASDSWFSSLDRYHRQLDSDDYTFGGKTVYVCYDFYDDQMYGEILSTNPDKGFEFPSTEAEIWPWVNSLTPYYIAWTMIYGELVNISDITVSWKRPVDGNILSTAFHIDFLEATGNGGR